jgi:hypothetical protein
MQQRQQQQQQQQQQQRREEPLYPISHINTKLYYNIIRLLHAAHLIFNQI